MRSGASFPSGSSTAGGRGNCPAGGGANGAGGSCPVGGPDGFWACGGAGTGADCGPGREAPGTSAAGMDRSGSAGEAGAAASPRAASLGSAPPGPLGVRPAPRGPPVAAPGPWTRPLPGTAPGPWTRTPPEAVDCLGPGSLGTGAAPPSCSRVPQTAQNACPGVTGDEHAGQSNDSTTRNLRRYMANRFGRNAEVSRGGPPKSIPRSLGGSA
jgi:hypothetical protein